METPETKNKIIKIIGSIGIIMAAVHYSFINAEFLIKSFDGIGFNPLIIAYFFLLILLIFLLYIYTKITVNNFKILGLNFKKWFVIPIGTLFLLISCFSVYVSSKSVNTSSEYRSYKKRIVLLFPLNEELNSAYQDGVRQLLGFTEYLKNNPEYSKNIEFRIFDHSMKVDVAERIIKEEIDEGTMYFFSTMSKVNVPLSLKFPEIVKSYNFKGQKPILVCGVTSAPTVNLKENSVYRYYIRSQEEAKILAEKGMECNLKSATFIAVADDYGRNAVEEFKKNWDGRFAEGVYLESLLTESEIQRLISDKILSIPPKDRQAIFICHYGSGIDNSISSLFNLNISPTILATSTLSLKEWQKPIENILNKFEWYTCVPDYKPYMSNQNDVIKNFTTFAIEKLVKSALDSSFVQTWSKPISPKNLKVEYVNGDLVVPMKVVYKNVFQ